MESNIYDEEFHSRTKILIDQIAISSSQGSSTIPPQWSEFSVYFTIGSDWSNSYAGQLMLLSSVNLIGRFCNHLFFNESLSKIRPVVDFPTGTANSMLEYCTKIALSINPFMTVRTVITNPKEAITFGVGVNADIVIASNNWLSYLNWSEFSISTDMNINPFGPMFASCLGSAEVFRKLVQRLGGKGPTAHRVLSNIQYSTLDNFCNDPIIINPPFPSYVDLGRVMVAGSGAVANGFMAALYLTNNVKGSVTLIDDESLDLSNIGRYYLTTLSDIGNDKAASLARYFSDSSITVTPKSASVESLSSADMQSNDIVISALDNRNNNRARIHLQNLLPHNIIHAATHGLSIAIANINFLEGICLGCLFTPREDDITVVPDTVCGGVTINLKDKKEISASVSFVSTASGILAASELIKKVVPDLNQFALTNYLSLSLISLDLSDVRFRGKDQNCLCLCSEPIRHESYRSKYTAKNN